MTEDDPMIQTPYGKKRESFLVAAMDAYEMLRELIEYEREAWDHDLEVDAADLVNWFNDFRQRAKMVVR